jgi:hypothetical protein
VKTLSAILFAVLLVGAQLMVAPTRATPAQPAHACCHCGGQMSCCAAPSPGSQPLPAIPSNPVPQKPLSISASPNVAPALPENRMGLVCPASWSSLMPMGAPLYARDCARLI